MRKHLWHSLIALPAAFALALGACGGGDGGGGGGGGSDEQYVQSLCDAFQHFSESMEKLGSQTDPAKAMEALVPAFEHFASEVEDARPPADVKKYHDDVVTQLKQYTKRIKDGDLAALDADPISEPPDNVKARLNRVAESNKTCKDSGFDF